MSTTTASTTAKPSDKDVSPSNTIITSLSLYLPLLLFAFLLFEFLRRRLDITYAPRKRNESVLSTLAEKSFGFLSWIIPSLRTSDQEVMEQCGLDTVCFLRFLRMGQKLSLLGIVMSFGLFPLYATGTHPMDATRSDFDPLEEITMSNVGQKDPLRVWGSVLAMYIMSIFAMYLFQEEFKVYVKLRHQFMSQRGPQQYTIVINYLPRKLRSNAALAEYMEALFPGQVHSVNVAVECGVLEDKVAQRVEIRNSLEHSMVSYQVTGKRPTHRANKTEWRGCETPVDSIQYYQTKLEKLNIWIAEEIKSIGTQRQGQVQLERGEGDNLAAAAAPPVPAEGLVQLELEPCDGMGGDDVDSPAEELFVDSNPPASAVISGETHKSVRMRRSAFVCLRTLRSTHVAQQLLQTEDPIAMSVLPAPHPRDIVWENIGTPWRQRQVWQIVSWVATVFIILFWTFPTAFVVSLATVEKLSENIPGMAQLFEDYPALTEFVKQLSPLGLIAMTMAASLIFGALSRREGHASLTQVNASFFSKLVYFQIFQIFFISVIAGTFFDSLSKIKELFDQPAKIVALLGATIPAQSTAFMAYLIVQAGLKLSLELLRVVPLIMGLIFRTGAPKLTKREKEATIWLGIFKPTSEPGEFIQAERLPNYYLSVLLIFAFCAIAPLLSYVAGGFLFLSDVVYRRQLLFVYDPSTHSTGVFWPKLHDCLVGALLLAQFTMLGVVSLKVTPGPATAATLLPFLTIVYYLYVKSLWPRTARNLPLNLCAKVDGERRSGEGNDLSPILNNSYTQPALLEEKPLAPENVAGEDEEGGSARGLVEVKISGSTGTTTNGTDSGAGGDVMVDGDFGVETQGSGTT